MTHWSTRTLAQAAVRQDLVPRIAHSTVALILRAADLQPHRSRYWKTPCLDGDFVERARKILWCYERVDRLREYDEVVVCLDEKPQLQALERRRPTVAMRAGRIERQEFERDGERPRGAVRARRDDARLVSGAQRQRSPDPHP
jgi:hypothetical protein